MARQGTQAAPRLAERRAFGRRNACKPATIVPAAGGTIACTIVNISDGGALLRFREPVAIPETFDLLIESDDMIVACRIAHRTNGDVGVQYVRSPRRASREIATRSKDAQIIARMGGRSG